MRALDPLPVSGCTKCSLDSIRVQRTFRFVFGLIWFFGYHFHFWLELLQSVALHSGRIQLGCRIIFWLITPVRSSWTSNTLPRLASLLDGKLDIPLQMR